MAGSLSIRTLPERVHLAIDNGDTRAWAEMDVAQAKMIRAMLTRAINHIESGASIAMSLEDLLKSDFLSARR